MSDPQSSAAYDAARLDREMGDESFALGFGALEGATSYLTRNYNQGGLDQSGAFAAALTNVREGNDYNPIARAQSSANVLAKKATSSIDEMNRLRSMLGGQGLKTTGLALQAGNVRNQAIAGMAPWDTAGSTAKAVAGGAAAYMGAKNQKTTKGGGPAPGVEGAFGPGTTQYGDYVGGDGGASLQNYFMRGGT